MSYAARGYTKMCFSDLTVSSMSVWFVQMHVVDLILL